MKLWTKPIQISILCLWHHGETLCFKAAAADLRCVSSCDSSSAAFNNTHTHTQRLWKDATHIFKISLWNEKCWHSAERVGGCYRSCCLSDTSCSAAVHSSLCVVSKHKHQVPYRHPEARCRYLVTMRQACLSHSNESISPLFSSAS